MAEENRTADLPLKHYSASQLQTFERCNRKWYLEKVEGFTSPSTEAQRYGTELHAQLENFLKTGEVPKDVRARGALRFLNKPSHNVLSERHLKIPLDGAEFVGFVDVTDLSDPTQPHVVDFKTTSDLQRYAKSDYQIEKDLQLNVYAYDTFQRLAPKATAMKISHLYIQSRGATKERLVSAIVQRKEVEERWKWYLRIIDNIEVVRAMKGPQDVEPNENACGDFGGCPHRARCNAIEFGGYVRPVLNPPDSTRRSADAPPAVPETVSYESLPKELRKAMDRATPNPEKKMLSLTMAEKLARMGNGPIQAPSPPATKEEVLANKVAEVPLSVVYAPHLVPPPAEVPFPEVFKCRGRPPGSKNKPNGEAPAMLPPDVLQAPPINEMDNRAFDQVPPPYMPPTDPPRPSAGDSFRHSEQVRMEKDTGGTWEDRPPAPVAAPIPGQLMFLFIDTIPVHGFPAGYTRLGQWLAPILEAIRTDTGADYSFADYGRGKAILNDYVRKATLPPALVVDSRSAEAGILWEYLISKASVIFQGLK